MTATNDPGVRSHESEPPVLPPLGRPTPPPSADRWLHPLTVAAVASISAGAVHAAAIGSHAEHPAAARVFVGVALFQFGWGALALARRDKAVVVVGAVGNAVLVGGWVLAKWKGLTFIPGLDVAEPIQFADGLCAALAAVSAAAAAAAFFGYRLPVRRAQPAFAVGAIAVMALVSLPGMIEAGNHVHGHSGASVAVIGGKTKVVTASVVPPSAYDPKKPIDMSGVKGVTLAQQARAENLIAETVVRLPQWASPAHAEASGFHSIGDGFTGIEHFINYKFVTDDDILDPDRPESLVYKVDHGKRTLVSAMYMLKPGANLNTVPDVGGPLTQWHIHDNLCFTGGKAGRVAGLTDASGNCRPPLVKVASVPMIHVWIVPHPCGPFAALNGVAAGSVKPGETRNCDHAHGSLANGL